MSRVLVTGGGGFVGVPLVAELGRRGHEVTVLDDFSVGSRERLAELAVEVAEADLRDAASVARAVAEARPEGVVHLAALHFIPDCVARPAETFARNVAGTQTLLDALADSPAEALLFASTGDVYTPAASALAEDDPTEPTNVYGLTKLTGEWLVRAFAAGRPETRVRVARLFNVYGPGETNPHVLPAILEQLREGDTLRLGNTEARRDWVYLDYAVAVLAGLLELPGDSATVNVGSGSAASVAELLDLLRELTGREITVETDPALLRPSDRPLLLADRSRLAELLPEDEPTPLREGLAALLAAEGLVQASGSE